MPPVRRVPPCTSLFALGLLAVACKDDAPPTTAAPRVETGRVDAKATDAAVATGTATAMPLAQATAAAPGKAKSGGQLGFDLAALSNLYALEGTPLAATWGLPGTGDPAAMRDDDLGTAWRCATGTTPAATQGNAHCVAGLSFTEPVTLHAVRLFAAAGPKWNDYRAHPRPKRVRLHTDAGWFDVAIEDGSAHHYINLAAPVTTHTLAVEVLEVHAGKKQPELWFAELEAFGSTGPTRPPLQLDPSRVVISFETEAWKSEGTGNTIRIAFAEELGVDGGARRRLMRATAIHGDADDRFLVVERRFGTDCTTDRGSYLLLDRETRVLFPLGDKGEVPAAVTLRADGLGVMFVRDAEPEHARALVYEGDQVVRHQPRTKAGETTKQLAARLGFVAAPITRGGVEPGVAIGTCVAGTTDEALIGRIGTALDLLNLHGAQASICDLSDGSAGGNGSKAVVGTDGAACGPRWYAAVVAPSGEIIAQNLAGEGDGDGAHFLPLADGGVVLEGTRAGGATSDLWRLDAKGITMIVKGGALAVRDPKMCRPCAPATPVVDETTTGGDEGGGADPGPPSDAPPADAPPSDAPPADAPPSDAPPADAPPSDAPPPAKPEPGDAPALPGVNDEPE
jgi:hypothetical protein